MSYSPYPAMELEALAKEYEQAAERFPETSKFREFYTKRAGMLRNANLCHDALRDRFLEQTTAHRAEIGRLQVPA